MSRQEWVQKCAVLWGKITKYKYALIILLIGVVLMTIPVKDREVIRDEEELSAQIQPELSAQLEDILCQIQGAGRTKVLLTQSRGPSVEYQVNTQNRNEAENEEMKTDTVLRSTGSGTEEALITSTACPTYRGALVICEGADSAAVRLSIVQAVSSLTGLGSDKIAVIKMNCN